MPTYRSNSLTEEEQKRLLEFTRSHEDHLLFKLALHTAIRREDITNIEIGSIDLEARKLTFWEAKKRRHWTVPLSQDMALNLERFIDRIPKGQKKLFTFSGRTAYNKLQITLKRAGIQTHISFHDLRRTFVKLANKKGLSDKAIQQITGDTQKVIQRHYANLDMEELKEEVEKL